ncbi:MAG: bi-domain-containing oxidoreductase, partial [Planctomycetaceae bacterium]
MKQILHSYANGKTELIDVPCPCVKPGRVLVGTHVSLISAGTERMLTEFGSAGLLKKALRQPDKVRMVLDKIRTDGLLPTWEAVKSQLDKPVAMGYCNVGTVVEVGAGVTEFQVGDRVVSNGPHAEFVCVGKNLCAKVPDDVSDESAVFTVIGSIALEAIRLAEPTLGESFAVIGLGLVGLMAVQLLKAHGCRVIGFDYSRERVALAKTFGAEAVDLSTQRDPVAAARAFSRDRGIDGVLIAASTTSDAPIHQAAEMSRKRGRIVMLGVTGMQLSRADFYEKELSFQVSCSYGPGRYDAEYEEAGHDYPLPYVRWTEQRNFEAVLDRLAERQIDAEALISHRFELERADQAYALIGSSRPSLGVILRHCQKPQIHVSAVHHTVRRSDDAHRASADATGPGVGFIGAGDFATRVLIPAFRRGGARLAAVASERGVSAVHAARKFDIAESTTDPQTLIESPEVDVVVVATRHGSHADYVCRALEAGKHVFVEKPLALNREQLSRVVERYQNTRSHGSPLLMVGFNRRFAPHVRTIKSLLKDAVHPLAEALPWA